MTFVLVWALLVHATDSPIVPSPWTVVLAIHELAVKGLLLKYAVASLFRVTWGYLIAVMLGVPLGLLLGWYKWIGKACNPTVQILRPISPLAWIPLAILWLGVGDGSAVFIIFLGSFFPLVMTGMNAVKNIAPTHINAGRNFGLSWWRFVSVVLFPAVAPQLIAGMRLTLGIAWLVVVAAEMIAVNSGLGFLIVDARNAGDRYDLIVAGMVLIGTLGLLIDLVVRRLERLESVRWGYSAATMSSET
jgi:NitT/TauT family transport system permease protein